MTAIRGLGWPLSSCGPPSAGLFRVGFGVVFQDVTGLFSFGLTRWLFSSDLRVVHFGGYATRTLRGEVAGVALFVTESEFFGECDHLVEGLISALIIKFFVTNEIFDGL